MPGGERTEFGNLTVGMQRQAFGRNDDLNRGLVPVADREPVPPRSVGGGRGRADVEVDVPQRTAPLRRGPQRLGAAVRAGSRGNAHAAATPWVEMLKRALRGRRDGDCPLVTPGSHENTVTSSMGRGLQFEVAVDIGDGAERRRRWGTIERRELLREPGDICLEIPPATFVCVWTDQRGERPHPLLLFRSGEGIAAALENPVERVVVAHADGIKFVVVAAGTAEAQAHDRLPHRVDCVLNREVVVVFRVEAEAARDRQIARGDDLLGIPLRALPRSLRGEDVAGDLLPEKLVVGQITVEGVDAIVAVAPGDRHGVVGGLAGGVGIADNVKPVSPPPLAIGGRVEEPIDDRRKRIGRGIAEECLHLLRGRRQAGQIKRRPPDERATISGRQGLAACRLLPATDKSIDRRPAPACVVDGRR